MSTQAQFKEPTPRTWIERISPTRLGLLVTAVMFVGFVAGNLLMWQEGDEVRGYLSLMDNPEVDVIPVQGTIAEKSRRSMRRAALWSMAGNILLSAGVGLIVARIQRTSARQVRAEEQRWAKLVEERSQEVVAAERKALLAEKLASLGQLSAGVAHEINTPIQYIGDNLKTLSDRFQDVFRLLAEYDRTLAAAGVSIPDPARAALAKARVDADLDYLIEDTPKAVDEALEGVARVGHIVRALKDFAHVDRGEPVHADLNRIVESTLIVARNEYKCVADVVTQLGELPHVECQPGDIGQVVLNLVVNAAHAIADTGRRGTIRVTTRHAGKWVELAIADTGTGIPAEIRERIFDPFFTTKEVGRGTGQGLSIAHQVVVQRHGGHLDLDSTVGVGTTFTLRLPIRAGQASHAGDVGSEQCAHPVCG